MLCILLHLRHAPPHKGPCWCTIAQSIRSFEFPWRENVFRFVKNKYKLKWSNSNGRSSSESSILHTYQNLASHTAMQVRVLPLEQPPHFRNNSVRSLINTADAHVASYCVFHLQRCLRRYLGDSELSNPLSAFTSMREARFSQKADLRIIEWEIET